MAEQFLTLMGELDADSQARMSGWYEELTKAGFTGTQTPGLPYHFSLSTFPVENEREAVELTQKVAAAFQPVPVLLSHIGIFPGGKVVFAAPERNAELDALHDACQDPNVPWTPHATILIDEPETVCAALPVLVKSFRPFTATITRLHLCAFWPTREILSVELRGEK